MTTLYVIGGKVELMTHEITMMLLILMFGNDGPIIEDLCNMFNTYVVSFSGPIKLNFCG